MRTRACGRVPGSTPASTDLAQQVVQLADVRLHGAPLAAGELQAGRWLIARQAPAGVQKHQRVVQELDGCDVRPLVAEGSGR